MRRKKKRYTDVVIEEVLNAVTVWDDSFANLVAYLLLYSSYGSPHFEGDIHNPV